MTTDRPSIDVFSTAKDEAFALTEAHTPELAAQYATVIRRAGRRAARRFRTSARLVSFQAAGFAREEDGLEPLELLAAGETPEWAVPPVDELLDVVQVTQDLLGATEKTRQAAAVSAVRPITSTMGVSFELEAPLVADLVSKAGVRAAKISIPGLRDAVYFAIKQAFEEGLSVDQTAALIYDKADNLAGYQAEMLARTDLIGTANGGSLLAAKTVWPQGGITKRWVNATDSSTENDGRIRPTHMEANGQEVPIDGHFIVGGARMMYPGDPAGPDEEVCNCFPAETLVRMPALRAVTRRWYKGDLVRVRLSSGDVLSGTPNHPVLRADGQWTALSLLNVGDDLVRADIGGHDEGTPYEDDVIAEIGEVYRLAEIAGDSERISGSPPYFHGDGSHEEIDVVTVDGSLLLDTEAATDEEVAQFGLTLADHARASACGRDGATTISGTNDRDLTSSPRSVSAGGESRSSVLIERSHADAVRFASTTNLKAERDEPACDSGTGDAERSAHSENALAASVSLSEIVHIDRYAFSGYVYNLDTGEGWYAAQSIIAANCRCTLVYHDALQAALWDESKHPRHPMGQREGGRFAHARGPATAIRKLDTASVNDVFVGDLDGEQVIVKPQSGLTPDRLRENVDPGRDLEREQAASIVANMIEEEAPDVAIPVPVSRIMEAEGYGRSGVSEFIDGETVAVLGNTQPARVGKDIAPAIRNVRLYDGIIGNTDRHDGNMILDHGGVLHAVDHGLAFPARNQTQNPAIQGAYMETELSGSERQALERVRPRVQSSPELAALLSSDELAATDQRIAFMLEQNRLVTVDDWQGGFGEPLEEAA